MSFDCATYKTEKNALAGAERNWINYVREQVSAGKKAVSPMGDIISDISEISDKELINFELAGFRENRFISNGGNTVAFATPVKAYNLDLWYYPLPKDRYMVGVEGCTVQTFSSSWEIPENE